MNRVPDRKKQRRDYLRKKATVYAIPVLMAVGTVGSIFNLLSPDTARNDGVVFTILTTLACVVLVALSSAHYSKARREAAKITHVASVTPSTLPADEILVRGAQEPSAPSETLLRAAGTGEETKADELLRSSQGG